MILLIGKIIISVGLIVGSIIEETIRAKRKTVWNKIGFQTVFVNFKYHDFTCLFISDTSACTPLYSKCTPS